MDWETCGANIKPLTVHMVRRSARRRLSDGLLIEEDDGECVPKRSELIKVSLHLVVPPFYHTNISLFLSLCFGA